MPWDNFNQPNKDYEWILIICINSEVEHAIFLPV